MEKKRLTTAGLRGLLHLAGTRFAEVGHETLLADGVDLACGPKRFRAGEERCKGVAGRIAGGMEHRIDARWWAKD
jgi:hypothetical protein